MPESSDQDQATNPRAGAPVESEESLLALADQLLAEGDAQQALTDADAGTLLRERALDRSTSSLEPGESVGHYRVEDLLGQGGMGAVYRGVDELLDRPVAIKTLRSAPGSLSTQARSRLLREARSLARLDHPGICRVYDFVEQGERRYLILELVDGVTLDVYFGGLDTTGAERRRRKLEIFEETSRALAVAHEAGIVHRDLKPDNVMIDAAGHVRVMDFGIARWEEVLQEDEPKVGRPNDAVSEPGEPHAAGSPAHPESKEGTHSTATLATQLTRPGSVLGTPAFMSPEQLAGETVTAATDIYSLGLMFGSAFAADGTDPAAHPASRKEVLEDLRSGSTGTGSRRPAPRDLQPLLDRMLDVDPERRPSAAAIALELARTRTSPQRRRRLAGLAAVAAVVLASLGFGASVAWQRLAESRIVADLPRPVMTLLLPMINETGDSAYDWAELGLRGLLEEALVDAAPVRVLDRQQTTDLAQILGRDDPIALERLARESGATLVVSPRLRRNGDRFIVDVTTMLPGGRLADREVTATDPVVATRAAADGLIRRIDPAAVLEESHSGDPFVDRLYAMAKNDIERGVDSVGANELLERALELEPNFARAHLQRAAGFTQSAEWQTAREEIDKALSMVDPEDDRTLYLEALDVQAGVHNAQGAFDASEETLRRMQAVLGETEEDRSWHIRLALRNARMLSQRGASHRLIELTEGLVADLETNPTVPMDLLMSHFHLGIGHINLKQFDDAHHHLGEALRMARELGMDRREGNILNSIGAAYETEERYEEALATYAEAEEIARRVGDVSQLMALVINRAVVLSGQQRFEEAHQMNLRALAFAEEQERIDAQALIQYNLSFTSCALGDFAQARVHWEESANFYDTELWDMLLILGWIQLEEGDPEARATLERSKEKAEHLWAPDWEELLQRAIELEGRAA